MTFCKIENEIFLFMKYEIATMFFFLNKQTNMAFFITNTQKL